MRYDKILEALFYKQVHFNKLDSGALVAISTLITSNIVRSGDVILVLVLKFQTLFILIFDYRCITVVDQSSILCLCSLILILLLLFFYKLDNIQSLYSR